MIDPASAWISKGISANSETTPFIKTTLIAAAGPLAALQIVGAS